MHFQTSKSDIQAALQKVLSVIPQKSTISCLAAVLLDLNACNLILTGTNLEISFKNLLLVENDLDENGQCLVNAKMLADIIKEQAQGMLEFTHDKNQLIIKSKTGEYKLSTLPVEDFPMIDFAESKDKITLPTSIFTEIEDKILFGVSHDELHPVLTGVLFEFKDNNLQVVSTDGHRMALYTFPFTSTVEKSVIVPQIVFKALHNTLKTVKNITISVNEDTLLFATTNDYIICKQISGTYPNWHNVYPKEFIGHVQLITEEIYYGTKRILNTAEDITQKVTFDIKDNDLLLFSNSIENGVEGNEKIDVVENTLANDFLISFNGEYLVEILKRINEETVKFNFTTDSRSCVISMIENIELKYVLMPLRN